jgi:sulfate transport system ATP-binding protein
VEATRAQEQAQRLPLPEGGAVWVGVRRIHALAHPGLHFLIPTDGSALAQAALDLGGQIARLAHARVTLLGYGLSAAELDRHLQSAKEKLGSGLASVEVRASGDALALAVENETERRPYDLVVLGCDPRKNIAAAEQVLQIGDHHVLLVPAAGPTPTRALICVAGGEPGKDDVLFAGRLARHLGAAATLFSVIPNEHQANRARAERFLAGGLRSLEGLGIAATASVGVGGIGDAIQQQLNATPHDWLVLGAPLNPRTGRVTLDGVVQQVLINNAQHPVLIVRSTHVAPPYMPMTTGGRIKIVEEVIP